MPHKKKPKNPFQAKIHEIIFEAETPIGKIFDISLLVAILLSVLIVMLESVEQINQKYGELLTILDWAITILFTLEYVLRIYAVRKPWRYIFSFYGLVDLLSIIPTYLSVFVPGSHYLTTIRMLRLLRVFRILKLTKYLVESQTLMIAIRKSQRKITVFLGAVLIIIFIVGSMMYFIEGTLAGNEKFANIPESMYWAIVTVTTVGYGDITPITALGKMFSALLMILAYGVLAVPTGIVSVELAQAQKQVEHPTLACKNCGREGHDDDADYCKFCGEEL